MFFRSDATVLVVAPHVDDGEFGCGGTIARLCEMGCRVHYAAFSTCEESLPPETPDILVRELHSAAAVLGIAPERLHVFRFRVRHFPLVRQEILEQLVLLERELQPEFVLLPSRTDLHQDHHAIAAEGLRAFKRTTVLSYEIPWNNLEFRNELFVRLEERHVERKVRALACYESQKERYYATEENVRAQLIMRGCQVGMRYAEVFEVVRAIAR